MYSKRLQTLTICFLLLIVPCTARSQDGLVKLLKPNGNELSIIVPAGYAGPKEAVFYAISKGNITHMSGFYLEGPGRTAASIQVKSFVGNPQRALSSEKGWYNVDLDIKRFRVPESTTGYSSQPFFFPGGGGEEFCNPQFIENLKKALEKNPLLQVLFEGKSDEEICKMLFGEREIPLPIPPGDDSPPGTDPEGSPGETDESGPLSPEENGWVKAKGAVLKNACDKRRTVRYLVRMKVDLSAVDEALMARGFTLGAAMKFVDYPGGMQATIKPVSDGQFAPNPLYLANTTRNYCWSCKEELFLVRWAGNKPASESGIRIEDYVGYKGLFLTRSVLGSQLRGGYGVFELTNGYHRYGVCMRLTRTRQYANGYPG